MCKKCNKCNIEKDILDFCKNKNNKDGLNYICKVCANKNRMKYIGLKREIPEYKKCSICEIEKIKNDFNKCGSSKDGLYYICKECRKPITKAYNKENRSKMLESSKNWRLNNPDYKFNSAEYQRERRKTDLLFRLRLNIGSLILISFKKTKTEKSYKTIDILGCSIEEFRKHIEKQFLKWMTWENHGGKNSSIGFNEKWDLDHIIPISSAKSLEEVYLLNHYSNFQPLCSRYNRIIKHSNIPLVCNIELRIDTQNEKINRLTKN